MKSLAPIHEEKWTCLGCNETYILRLLSPDVLSVAGAVRWKAMVDCHVARCCGTGRDC